MAIPSNYIHNAEKDETKTGNIKSRYTRLNDQNFPIAHIRILSEFIIGKLRWEAPTEQNINGKPHRWRIDDKEPSNINWEIDKRTGKENYAKIFWAAICWNYNTKQIEIVEITQKTIQDQLFLQEKDDNWGDLINYDIKISPQKEGGQIKSYSVIPIPPKKIDEEIQEKYESENINLYALFDGTNPFIKK